MLATGTFSQTSFSSGFTRQPNYSQQGLLSRLMYDHNIFARHALPQKPQTTLAIDYSGGRTGPSMAMLKNSLNKTSNFASQLIGSLFSFNKDSKSYSSFMDKGNFINILG